MSKIIEEAKELLNKPEYQNAQNLRNKVSAYEQLNKNPLSPGADEYDKTPTLLSQFEKEIEGELCAIKGQIQFVNRVDELRFLTGRYCPQYLLLDAPQGFGKSSLLKEVERDLQTQQWFCIRVELPDQHPSASMRDLANLIFEQITANESSDLSTPEKAGDEIGAIILKNITVKNLKNIILILDAIEALQDEVVMQFLDKFIVVLQERLYLDDPSVGFRLIMAGRHVSYLTKLPLQIRLKLKQLSPFDFDPIYTIVDQISSSSNRHYKQELAAYVMNFTGGHPACIVEMIQKTRRHPITRIVAEENTHYQNIIKPVITAIQTGIENFITRYPEIPFPHLKEMLLTLSVVRCFNIKLIEHFIRMGCLEWPKKIRTSKIEEVLLQMHFVDREKGFLKDGITRRLLAMSLRRDPSKVEHFVNVCIAATTFYQTTLETLPACHCPEMLAVEWIFQALQVRSCQTRRTKEEFFTTELAKILQALVKERDAKAVLESFIDLVEKDWELRFTFNYLFRQGTYNHQKPFDEFLDNIHRFYGEQMQQDNEEGDNEV